MNVKPLPTGSDGFLRERISKLDEDDGGDDMGSEDDEDDAPHKLEVDDVLFVVGAVVVVGMVGVEIDDDSIEKMLFEVEVLFVLGVGDAGVLLERKLNPEDVAVVVAEEEGSAITGDSLFVIF